ncbi:MAG: BTAD domain-containing putative transcriptional regulator, partial [Actinophytocola sp.]
ALADAGVPAARVARQLAAAPAATPSWLVEWLGAHHRVLVNRDPEIAADLLDRAVRRVDGHDPLREELLVALVRVLVRLGRAAEEPARAALAEVTDPELRVRVRELLATVVHRRGDTVAAAELLEPAMAGAADATRARLRRRLAELRLGGPDMSTMERAARAALRRGATDSFAADAHQALWTVSSARGDHRRALRHLDRALNLTRDDPATHLGLLENRVRTLHDRDELAEAARTLAETVEPTAGLRVAAAAHRYWTGRWDEALVELDQVSEDGAPGAAILLRHGIAALIAARRDDADRATVHLEAAADHAPPAERDAVDFLLVARSALAERDGDVYSALRLLMPLVRHDPARRTAAGPWLPRFVRLSLSAGDADLVARALAVCEQEATREVPAARSFAAAEWSRGLVLGHAAGVLRAAERYRAAGRRPDLASALEDAAVLLGATGAEGSAAARDESLAIHAELAAGLDLRRARERFGSGPHARPVRAGDAVRTHVAAVIDRLDRLDGGVDGGVDVAEGTRP